MKKLFFLVALIVPFLYSFNTLADSLSVGTLKNDSLSIEIAQKISQRLKKRIKIVNYKNTSDLKQSLSENRTDFILANFDSFSLKNYHYLSTPYLYQENILFTRNDSRFKTLDSLYKKKVAYLKDGNQKSLLHQLNLKPKPYSSADEIILSLKQKKVAGAILTSKEYSRLISSNVSFIETKDNTQDQTLFRINNPKILSSPLIILTHQKKLRNQLNDAISDLKEDGTLGKISVKYLDQNVIYQ